MNVYMVSWQQHDGTQGFDLVTCENSADATDIVVEAHAEVYDSVTVGFVKCLKEYKPTA